MSKSCLAEEIEPTSREVLFYINMINAVGKSGEGIT